MSKIYFNDQELPYIAPHSLLDTLLNANERLPYSCKAGACQACLVEINQGKIPEQAQQGLSEEQKEKNYALACQCYPDSDLHVQAATDTQQRISVMVSQIEHPNPELMILTLLPMQSFNYQAGQYITLWRDAELGRSYSLASVPGQDMMLSLHIRRYHDGALTPWLFDSLSVGSSLEIQGPYGDCHYQAESPQQPLLLVGGGTGLAPLYGIAREALAQGHQGPIHLVQGARSEDKLYHVEQLNTLAQQHPQLHYHPSVLDGPASQTEIHVGHIDDIALSVVGQDLNGWQIYLCGSPSMVERLQKKAFLAGAKRSRIFADAFITQATDKKSI